MPVSWLAHTALGTVTLTIVLYLALEWYSPRIPVSARSELSYRSTDDDEERALPSLKRDTATVELSVVVPAYNETKRIGTMLQDAVQYLESADRLESTGKIKLPSNVQRGTYEILVVDDGSKDGTAAHVLALAKELAITGSRGQVKVVQLAKNRGKGGATRHGCMHASGHTILFCDADGASHFPDLTLLEAELQRMSESQKSKVPSTLHGVIVGSRAHLVRTEAVVKRSFLRNLLMRGFHTYLWILGIRSIRDTQCGFKLCTRASAATIYPLLHSPSWIFDCELLLLASLAGIPIREVGIQWHEVDGSKVDLVRDSIGMAVDLLVIRANYACGKWQRPKWVGIESVQDGERIVGHEESAKSK